MTRDRLPFGPLSTAPFDVAPEVTVEEIRSKTEAAFTMSPDLKVAA